MILSTRAVTPRRLLAVAAAALVPLIAGCEAGANAPVFDWHQPTPGASAMVGTSIRVNDMFVLGAAANSALPVGGSAAVYLALDNSGPADTLISMSAPGSASSVLLPRGGVRLGSQQSVLLTGPAAKVVLVHLTHRLSGGQSIPVVLDFANAGTVTLNVPVLPRAGAYASFSPAPSPSPSPSRTGTPTPTPSGTAQAPSASPSPSRAPMSPGPTPTPTS